MFSRKARAISIPSLTPLADAIFLLMIFFMLASSFKQTGALPLSLAAPSQQQASGENSLATLLIQNGQYLLNGMPVPQDSLEQELHRIALQSETSLHIRAAPDAQVRHAALALALAQKAGLSRIQTFAAPASQ